MNHELKTRILDQLLSHLESMDASDLKPKPKELGVEVTSPDGKEMKDDEMKGAVKGPMEKLMEEKSETPAEEAAEPKDEDDMSDEELAELLKEHLK